MDSTEIRTVFANNLKHFRKSHNPPLTQEKLSELVGKNQNYIGLIEKGKSSPPLEMIAIIAQKLEIEPCLLLDTSQSIENIKKFDTENLISSLTNNVVDKLKTTIAGEIRSVLC